MEEVSWKDMTFWGKVWGIAVLSCALIFVVMFALPATGILGTLLYKNWMVWYMFLYNLVF